MKKASIVIGVDRTGQLSPLQGAASGAAKFDDWAKKQGCDSVLLTDANNGNVTITSIFNEVKRIVDAMTYEQLIIFFSGHGQLTAPNWEVWLLSGAPDNPNEAVNLPGSMSLARESGLKHVVFISDACRSIPDNTRRHVTGSLIFPPRNHFPGPDLDCIYATRPGDPALEAPKDKAIKDYRGLLTECLLEGLSGKDASVVQQFQSLPTKPWVVPTRPLRDYLARAVPKAAAAIGLQYQQYPDVVVGSAEPYYLAEVAVPASPSRSLPSPPRSPAPPPFATSPLALPHVIEAYESLLSSPTLTALGLSENDKSLSEKIGLEASIEKVLSTKSRVSFETRTGFSFNGSRVVRALSSVTGGWIEPGHPDFFMENDAWHVRAENHPQSSGVRTLLAQFEGGTGACLAILPNFVGSVLVEEGRVTNVNYVPARGTPAFNPYIQRSDEIEKRRAVIAAAARQGTFAVRPGDEGLVASYLREMKAWDPTLGIYAAYAAMQKGDRETIQSIHTYMKADSSVIPFDVALLAGKMDPAAGGKIAPACPMVTQGWAYLDRYTEFIPAEVVTARTELVPGLWTTFTPNGVELLANALINKAIL